MFYYMCAELTFKFQTHNFTPLIGQELDPPYLLYYLLKTFNGVGNGSGVETAKRSSSNRYLCLENTTSVTSE